MAITLMPLPYEPNALEPAISADTLLLHHGKHHKAYVDKVNALTIDSNLADQPIEAVIAAARKQGSKALFNNAAQVWNHGFYWESLSDQGGEPSPALAEAINAAFGSPAKLIEALIEKGTQHFASGWVWLVRDGGQIGIADSHDAETLADHQSHPLLVFDVWEHAYYLDYRNERPRYLKTAVEQLINWRFASERFETGERWTYPG